MNVRVRQETGGLAHEVDAHTPTSEIIVAIRDEAERRGIRIAYGTLTDVVGPNAALYRKEMLIGNVFVGGQLMPPSILRVRDKLRNEMRGFEAFGK